MTDDSLLKNLLAEKQNLLKKLEKVEALIKVYSSDEDDTAGLPPLRGIPRPSSDQSFRDVVRSVLKNHKEGLRAPKVADLMEQAGYKYHGKVRFKTVVSSELWRMKNIGQVVKKGNLYFIK